MKEYEGPPRKRVLVVEDDYDMNELVCVMLDDAGYETLQAFCGDEGLRLATEFRPDLVLLDIMLPDVNGIDICRNISTDDRTYDIPVIMMTCRNDLTSKLSSYVSGAKRYITKPFEETNLLTELERTLTSKSAREHDLPPGIAPDMQCGPGVSDSGTPNI